jgi:predicted Zn-dependent peptidase
VLSTSCRTEVAAQAITTSLELLDVRPAPLTPIETADAINFLVGIAPLRYDTASPIALQASAMAAAGLTCDWINGHYARIASVDADQATQALATYINPTQMHVVTSGPADRLVPELRQVGLEPEVIEPDL